MEDLLARTKTFYNKAASRVSRQVHRTANKTLPTLAIWITRERTGFYRAIDMDPKTGFIGSIKYLLTCLAISVIGTFISGLLIFILISFGIPLLIHILLQ